MIKRFKDFGAATTVPNDPVVFAVDGEEFECVAAVQGAAILDFVADAGSGDGSRAGQALVKFLRDVVIEDDKERFEQLINDPKRIVPIETIGEICGWLIEQYSERPQTAPTPSSAGSKRSGRGSTVGASARG